MCPSASLVSSPSLWSSKAGKENSILSCLSLPKENSLRIFSLRPGRMSLWAPGHFMKESDGWMVFAFSLGNTDEVFSVDADTGNLTMNKIVTSPDSFLLQVMVSDDIPTSLPAQLDFQETAAWVWQEPVTSRITRLLPFFWRAQCLTYVLHQPTCEALAAIESIPSGVGGDSKGNSPWAHFAELRIARGFRSSQSFCISSGQEKSGISLSFSPGHPGQQHKEILCSHCRDPGHQ